MSALARRRATGLLPLLIVAALSTPARAESARRGVNLLANPGFEDGAAGWGAYAGRTAIDTTVAHSGTASLRCEGATLDDSHGVRQVITLDPPLQHPFRVSGWAKAENAEVGRDFDVFLDLHYADGTPLWGQVAPFQAGTHDWQYSEHRFEVAKPVRTIEVFVLFRKAKGKVWFDDVRVDLEPFEFRHVKVLPGAYGGTSLLAAASTSLPAAWTAAVHGPHGPLFDARGTEQPARLVWRHPTTGEPPSTVDLLLTAKDNLLGETIELRRTVPLPPGGPPRDIAVWVTNSMTRVLPSTVPDTIPEPPRAQVSLAGNEAESFQVVLLGPVERELRNVAVEVSDLVSTDGKARIPRERIEWQQVGWVRVEKLTRNPAYADAVPGWWPDPLLPVATVTVPSGFAAPVWVTVSAAPETPRGDYTGTITIRPPDAAPVAVQVAVQVYGFSLPARGHLKTAFALMDGYLEKVYGTPLAPALRRQYGDFVLRHRLNPDDISRTAPPALEDLLHYRDRGLNAFNVLNMVEERGSRTWVCWSAEKVYTPAFRQRLVERLDPYVAQLRQAGLADLGYIYTFDERGKEFYPIMREYFGMVKTRYPEIRTLTTAKVPQEPQAMRDLNVDWNCPLTSVYRFDQAETCRAAGLQVWAYVCCGPRYPYANWLADDPLVEARVLWWQAFQQKMDGILYWGLNIWGRQNNGKPIDPAAGPLLDWGITSGAPGSQWERLHGDGELLYAGKAGPLGSIRLANIRDGLEDYEYLWLLSQTTGGVETARDACGPVTEGLTHFTRDPAAVYASREGIARRMEKAVAGNR